MPAWPFPDHRSPPFKRRCRPLHRAHATACGLAEGDQTGRPEECMARTPIWPTRPRGRCHSALSGFCTGRTGSAGRRAAESHTAFRGSPHRVSGIPTGRVTRYVRVPRQRPRRLSVQELATPEQETGIHPRWYVLVTSATGKSVFATMGPYRSENGARHAADGARVVHYRVGQARSRTGSFGSSGARTGPGVGGVRFRHT